MAYQIINEQFGIMGCTPDDLTESQAQMLREQFPEEEVGDFTVLYNPNNQKFVVNYVHRYYEHYLPLLTKYIEFPKKIREIFKELIINDEEIEDLIGLFEMIDTGLADRESKKCEKRWKDAKSKTVRIAAGAGDSRINNKEIHWSRPNVYTRVGEEGRDTNANTL